MQITMTYYTFKNDWGAEMPDVLVVTLSVPLVDREGLYEVCDHMCQIDAWADAWDAAQMDLRDPAGDDGDDPYFVKFMIWRAEIQRFKDDLRAMKQRFDSGQLREEQR